jgi:hypothetical protein
MFDWHMSVGGALLDEDDQSMKWQVDKMSYCQLAFPFKS